MNHNSSLLRSLRSYMNLQQPKTASSSQMLRYQKKAIQLCSLGCFGRTFLSLSSCLSDPPLFFFANVIFHSLSLFLLFYFRASKTLCEQGFYVDLTPVGLLDFWKRNTFPRTKDCSCQTELVSRSWRRRRRRRWRSRRWWRWWWRRRRRRMERSRWRRSLASRGLADPITVNIELVT